MTLEERERWLAQRKKYITASDAAAVLGLSPYKKPLDVFYDKTCIDDSRTVKQNKDMERGVRNEVPILNYYRSSFDNHTTAEHNTSLVVSTAYPFLAATPDAVLSSIDASGTVTKRVLDIKCPRRPWGKVPRHYEIQVWAQMVCLGVEEGALIVCLENAPETLEVFPVTRGQFADVEESWLATLKRFHEACRVGTLPIEFW